MKSHPAIDALQSLSDSLTLQYEQIREQGATTTITRCPVCGPLHLYERVEDDPKLHKPECVLVQVRLFLGRIRASQESMVKLKADDVLVSLGDMSEASEKRLELDESYEGMVEDFIEDFNQMVAQGQTPMKAFFCMSQAFAIVWGCCIRAGLKRSVGDRIMRSILKNCDASSKMVQIITKQ